MRRTVAVLDLIAIAVFVLIGRASHHHGETVGGFVSTAWPFLIGLVVGWLVTAKRPPVAPVTGLVVCAATVAVGMVLRVVAGQGTAVAFIIVALTFLGLWMVGGRVLMRAVSGRDRVDV